MSTSGLTPQGFTPKTVLDLISDVEAGERTNIDAQIDTSPEMPLGQLNGVFCEKLAEIWELLPLLYNGLSRNGAEGPQLDNVNNLTGTKRRSPTPSYTLQTCVFSQTGTFSVGALVANVSGQPAIQFANGDDVAVTGPSGGLYTATNTDNNVVLATSATLPISVPGIRFFATVDGPVVANAGTLTQITTPVTGWSSTTNLTDAVMGTNIEADGPYRLRGDQELSAAGSGTPDAMRADVLNISGVIQAFVLNNTLDFIDIYGNPPHSFTVVIWDGASPAANDSAVAQAIWNDKPDGIQANGNVLDGVAIDILGNAHTVPFSRAQQQLLYLTITCNLLPGQAALTPTAALAMKQAIVAASQTLLLPNNGPNPAFLGLGNTVYVDAIRSALISAGMGVAEVTSLKLGFGPAPTGTTDLFVSAMQIAIADTSRITINGL